MGLIALIKATRKGVHRMKAGLTEIGSEACFTSICGRWASTSQPCRQYAAGNTGATKNGGSHPDRGIGTAPFLSDARQISAN